MSSLAEPRRRSACGGLRFAPVSEGIARWERELVARVEAGDDTALATIYDQYGALVFGIARRMVGNDAAVDVSQEVFAALWDRPERFDAAKGSLRTFLAMLTRRRCIDHLRRHGRREANERRASDPPLATVPNVDEAALAMLAAEHVRTALERLPAQQREAIELAYMEGLTFREVATRTGAAEGTAKSRIRLGLQRLAMELQAGGQVAST